MHTTVSATTCPRCGALVIGDMRCACDYPVRVITMDTGGAVRFECMLDDVLREYAEVWRELAE